MGTYHLINTFTNQKSDVLNLIINGCFAFVDDGVVDTENMILRPGGFIEEGVAGNVRPLHPNTNVTLAFNEINDLRRRGELSSGANAYETGAIQPGKRTAYEANLIKQGSATRFNDVTMHLSDTVMEYMLNFCLDSVKQFKYGSGEVPDEALLGEYRINYLGAQLSASQAYDMQQLMTLTDIIARNPELAGALNPPEYLGEIHKRLNIKNDKVIKTADEYEAFMKQRQEAELAAKSGGVGGSQGQVNPDAALAETGLI